MSRLLERDASVLIVVDAQAGFLAGDDAGILEIVSRIAWLTGVAAALEVPVVVTEEEPDRNGPTEETILVQVPAGSPVLIKPVFGLADTPAILAAIEATGRRAAVLVGTETDVCITHAALGLLDRDHQVAVVSDATYSPGAMHEHGLRRIAEAGGTVIHAKGVYYEWLRTVEATTASMRPVNPGSRSPASHRTTASSHTVTATPRLRRAGPKAILASATSTTAATAHQTPVGWMLRGSGGGCPVGRRRRPDRRTSCTGDGVDSIPPSCNHAAGQSTGRAGVGGRRPPGRVASLGRRLPWLGRRLGDGG